MEQAYTISAFTEALRAHLAARFAEIWVEGEVGGFTRASSGHWYFNLVEGRDVLGAVMFRNQNGAMGWRPRDGDRILACGRVDAYGPRGRYQLIARALIPSGEGARARALEALRLKLGAEGLFAPERKRPIPFLPRAIGVATSRTGAALQDILEVLWRRFPGLPVYLAHCQVQGEGAAASIAAAIARLNDESPADVLIVGRGGGSTEDLWAFNEEAVVRALAASRIPVISAVGHETDLSLADLAADLRAPTPSAAAELAVPELDELARGVAELEARLGGAIRRAIARDRERLAALHLRHPREKLQEARRRLEDLERRQQAAIEARLESSAARLALSAARLEALSPLSVLGRGFAVVSSEGRAVRNAEDVLPGDELLIRLKRGKIRAEVIEWMLPWERVLDLP